MLEQGGLAPGGLNFDAKVRRESTDVRDMFIAHIGQCVKHLYLMQSKCVVSLALHFFMIEGFVLNLLNLCCFLVQVYILLFRKN